jgi:hypothetical protein
MGSWAGKQMSKLQLVIRKKEKDGESRAVQGRWEFPGSLICVSFLKHCETEISFSHPQT